jgi:hypothetical protein
LLDKVPNQQIVPFVEDHRNILILAPKAPLELEAMATLQAALKRGIEMTFQIEESELVAEPLPKQDDRKALLFYEAAEGGAGVLTRLATEPQAMAQVAAAALRLLHHNDPVGPWAVDDLLALEQKNDDGQSICEAGCYQCLLSYFNQPDHDHINRRNAQALEMLVALANAQVAVATDALVQPLAAGPATPAGAENPGDLFSPWQQALQAGGHKAPDQTQLPVLGGQLTVAGQYKTARALVVLTVPDAAHVIALADKGWTVLDMSDPAQWADQFAGHPHVFS